MAKTTKQTRGIHSWIKFQKHQGVESLTIQGKEALADLSQDKNGDTNLILNADKDKVNAVASSVPYLGISHTTTGTNPNQEKTATISQDLTQFPLYGGELVAVTKEHDSLTIDDDQVKEFVNNAITEALSKVPITVAHYGGLIGQFDRQETNISFQNDEGFNHYLMVTAIGKNNVVSQFKFAREDFINNDAPYKIVNDFVISVKAELTDDKHLVLIFNAHDPMDIFEYQIMYEWFTNYESASIDPAYQEKRIRVKHSEQSEHFEGYKNPVSYEPNVPLEYKPNTPPSTTETPSEPTIETEGNVPQPLADEESH